MGDRVCVDLCSLMKPGEGLLVFSVSFCVHKVFVFGHELLVSYLTVTCITQLQSFRLDPLQEVSSLFTQSAWSQITFLAGLFESMR